jgi:D-3-phosphoglycerate dehydrogenase
MTQELSFPKEKIKILLLENLHPRAVQVFGHAGYTNVTSIAKALNGPELAEALADVHIVGIRSKTQLTGEILAAAPRLLAVGAFCIGTNQIDLRTATQRGVAVFNSPYSSTRSVAELVIGASISLLRGLYQKSQAVHQGQWPKSATGSRELRGKTLGIVGYGRIGSQVSVLAEALGMHVQFFDIEPKLVMGNARALVSLAELLQHSDVVSLHVPATPQTQNIIDAAALAQMKPGSCLINYARGSVVDIDALAHSLRSGHLGGAAVDVFPVEPASASDPFESPLCGLENVILSPHIGGSTEEAQENIGIDAATKLVKFLDQGVTIGSVTLPELNLPPQAEASRLLHIHKNTPGMVSQINQILSQLEINILSQFLKTNEDIGYVVFDIAKGKTDEALARIRQIPNTIRARSLY